MAAPESIASNIKTLVHQHDEVGGVYRVVVGREVIVPAHLLEVPVLDEGGNQQLDEDGRWKTTAQQVPEEVVGHVDVQEYVFADDDPAWVDASGVRISDEEAAAIQKDRIREARRQQQEVERRIQAQAASLRALPGVGEDL